MQRPPTMMNVSGGVPQPNAPVGVPSMRSMVAQSPMQAAMMPQQSPQGSMMSRPVGNPYGVMNRTPIYDKTKRPSYTNDPRQQPMMQPGQQPMMPYGAVMAGPNQAMMPNAGGAGPIRPQ